MPVFSPAYLRHVGPASLQHRFFFDVGKERAQKLQCGHKPRPNHALPSCLELFLGRTLYAFTYYLKHNQKHTKIALKTHHFTNFPHCTFSFPTFISVDRFHLHSLPQHLGNLIMVSILGVHPRGFPFLVLNADISTCGYEEGGDGCSTESSCHVEWGVAREVTAVLVAGGLDKLGRRERGRGRKV